MPFISLYSSTPPASVNLTTEGILDWGHWGLVNSESWNRKNGVSYIGNFSVFNSAAVGRFADAQVQYSWSNGTPTASATNTITGLYFGHGQTGNRGYTLTIDVFNKPHQLKIYTSTWDAAGYIDVYFASDTNTVYSSTIPKVDGSASYKVFTIKYQGDPSDHLIFKAYKTTSNNITLQAVTLKEDDVSFILYHNKKQNTLLRI